MRYTHLAPLLVLLAPLTAQSPAVSTEGVDQRAIELLRRHGLEQSQVMEHLSALCDVYGPRLTGSPNLHQAQTWAADAMRAWGLQARLEPWGPFGRGWQFEKVVVHVVGANPWPVIAYPKAWSPSVAPVEAEVIAIGALTAEQVAALDLRDKVVLLETPREVSEPFDATARRWQADDLLALADGASPERPREREQRAGPAQDFRTGQQKRDAQLRLLYEKQPLAIFDRSYKGDYGTVFVQGAAAKPAAPDQRVRPYAADAAPVIPQFTLAVEHYNRIVRLLQRGAKVRVALELRANFTAGDGMERNVIAELPGRDPAIGSEVVMLGAHLDSWHAGTGATDNGCGSAVVMEAMRLLTCLQRELGRGPRRTIRAGLWSGEEQGLLGSRAYVNQQFATVERGKPATDLKPAHAKFAAYFNLDNGTGKIRGVYLQGNEAAAPIFRAWLKPFHDLGARTLTLNDTGGTDHLAFDAAGLPGFQFIQDPVAYDLRTHHSNMDNWDHAVAADLQQAATIMAAFAWHAAERDAQLPRKQSANPEVGR